MSEKNIFNELEYVDIEVDTFNEIYKVLNEDIKNKTIIFDIDQTLLLHSAKNGRGCVIQFFQTKINTFVRQIYEIAIKVPNLHIYFITARHDTSGARERTEEELNRLGYTKYDGIFFRKSGERDNLKYKTDVRTKLEDEMNLIILLNIGDKWSDINGGHSKYIIKLSHVPSKNFWSN